MATSVLASLAAFVYLQAPLSAASSHHGLRHRSLGHSSAPKMCSASSAEVVNNSTEIFPYQTFHSFTGTPPRLNITANGEELAEGLIFFGPNTESGAGKPKEVTNFIMTDTGDLVYAHPPTRAPTDFKAQTLNGKPVVTYYTPVGTQPFVGIGWGNVHILDDTYKEIHTVCPKLNLHKGDGTIAECGSDLHEHYITEDNTLLTTAFNVTQYDLTPLGGTADDWILNAIVLELDIESGEVLWQWSLIDHIPILQSHAGVPKNGVKQTGAIDLYHMNSIQSIGDYIFINCRHTWSSYLINRKTGEIEWTIDGETGGDFGKLPENGTFVSTTRHSQSVIHTDRICIQSWEHHGRLHNMTESSVVLSYFANNNNAATKEAVSKGIVLELTLPPNPDSPPKLLADLYDATDLQNAWAEGSTDILSNGNYFMGYGSASVIKEYGPGAANGQDVRWTGLFDAIGGGDSYRAFKQVWHATPASPPSLVISSGNIPESLSKCTNSSDSALAYVSWNGATDVTSYDVYAGSSEDDLELIGTVDKQGFETVFPIHSTYAAVMVSALDRNSSVVKIN
ncbi:uncharacterized protein TRUGW13939_00180 [Talaromyces rugulosus]|uniref:ASST-domain-containing protein n=1 Tax=Talaromyces rugulosus TaxID=121627 RepID=A0A7H8QGN4_TALRU|nr:uncharacterized protein TRUGW13939_00180 [Talaromyces rugulosus]QKX53108.1 hypothetical protein TRUGW13939_00180 [Talaromyces rugulosus]